MDTPLPEARSSRVYAPTPKPLTGKKAAALVPEPGQSPLLRLARDTSHQDGQTTYIPVVKDCQEVMLPQLLLLSLPAVSDPDEILQLLTSSNPITCPLDPIPSGLFQTITRELLPFISVIMNNSLSSGYVPTAFKTARVVPILKKATLDSSSDTNDRPNQLHDPNQSGYKPAHSTETALIAVTEKLHAAKPAKQSSVMIFLDLSAAFDTVNHNILLSVLSRLGVTGSAWRWFQSYLDGWSYQHEGPEPTSKSKNYLAIRETKALVNSSTVVLMIVY
ncbi:hypothetical protein P4O66_000146 [Electrophorus voltai]|uniref:Reverse transcriptase domain-containing protein n=1 Tax=Electrophorus voltai TaxID=2609070 RepID=A0AAD8ZWH7_9TELE|nr:hypothetical protein P4O66_000146 [Electrophorus voltai]